MEVFFQPDKSGHTGGTTVWISDCNKGRGSGLDELGLGANSVHLHCSQHIKENTIQKRGGITLNKYFWNIARATTLAKFDYHMEELHEISASTAEYLEAIDPTTWAEAYVPVCRFGHDTSNVVEPVNSVLKLDRELDVLSLLNSIWDRLMDNRQGRYCKALHELKLGTQDTTICKACEEESVICRR